MQKTFSGTNHGAGILTKIVLVYFLLYFSVIVILLVKITYFHVEAGCIKIVKENLKNGHAGIREIKMVETSVCLDFCDLLKILK